MSAAPGRGGAEGEGPVDAARSRLEQEGMKARGVAWEAEATARARNAEPWEPLPGLVKRQCPQCRYFFAAPADLPERRCLDCASLGTGKPRTPAPHGA